MASLGIDGLVSGLDTTTIISQLMQIEAAPQTLLKSKQATTQDVVTALQSINAKLRSLAEAATSASTAKNWAVFSATSSHSAVSAKASGASTAASLTFSVDSVATAQVSLSQAVADGSPLVPDPPLLTIRHADGTMREITAAGGSPQEVAKAVNDADAGVIATVVRVPSGGGEEYRVQFTSAATGSDGTFEVFAGDEAAATAGTATRIDTSIAREASDAAITLWKGSAHEQTYTQSSNTFVGLMTGVDVTVSKVTAADDPVTVTVAADHSAVKSLASGLVGALAVVLSDMDSRTATTTVTNDDGTTSVTGGLLSGDAGVRMLRTQLLQAASYPVDGVSPSSVGIVLGRDGTVTFDEAAFAQAVADDPEGTAAFVQELAARVETATTAASDPYEGTFTAKVESQQSLVDRYATQIAQWDVRLEQRRATLQATYTNLEVTLSNLNSQSSWLESQLSALTTS
ncbi:flagellar filament capping protein FliD [Demequina sp.]|uniref:flagellar filament capping protein FliD n=1 Tax=Demequina sp. TaxID=2050685 RepID=UPI003A870900